MPKRSASALWPIVPLMLLQGFVIFSLQTGVPLSDLHLAPIGIFVVMLWAPFLAWELARKIRAPEEEDDYVTYTRLLGRPGAVLATCFVQALALGLAIFLWRVLDLHPIGLALILGAFGVNVWAGIRFLVRPTPGRARLRPFAIAYVLAVLLSPIVGVVRS